MGRVFATKDSEHLLVSFIEYLLGSGHDISIAASKLLPKRLASKSSHDGKAVEFYHPEILSFQELQEIYLDPDSDDYAHIRAITALSTT